MTVSPKSIEIKWRQIKTFNCNENNIEGISIHLIHEIIKELVLEHPNNFHDTEFELTDIEHIFCYPWVVIINMKFFERRKDFQKAKVITPTKFAPENLKIERINQTSLMLSTENEDGEINCVNEAKIVFIVPKQRIANLPVENNLVDLGDIFEECTEYVIQISIQSVLQKKIAKSTETHFPELGTPTFGKNEIIFPLVNSTFSDCNTVRLLIQCKKDEETNKTVSFEVVGLTISSENVTGVQFCRAKAFIAKDDYMELRKWSNWFNLDGMLEKSDLTTMTIASSSSIVIVLLMSIIALAVINKRRNKWNPYISIKKPDQDLPPHLVFENSDNLHDELCSAVFLQSEVMEDFEKLEKYVKENIEIVENFKEASEHLVRNRYRNILPYDSNCVTLLKPTGNNGAFRSDMFVFFILPTPTTHIQLYGLEPHP